MNKRSVISGNGETVYWINDISSNKNTLVFLHGLSADHTLFDKQIPYFEKRYNIIAWDAPMHALSRPYKNFTYENCAVELKSILDKEHVAKAVMIGQSMGGYCIQAYIKLYPETVSAFVGIDTCPFGKRYYSASDYWWLKQIGWMSTLYPYKTLVESVARSVAVSEYAYENMKQAISRYSKKELCELMDVGYRQFTEENSDMDIVCPVLLLVGEHDKTGKVKQYCRMWREETGYPLTEIKNAAHNSNADNSEQVNAAIDEFLKNNSL